MPNLGIKNKKCLQRKCQKGMKQSKKKEAAKKEKRKNEAGVIVVQEERILNVFKR